MVSPAEVRAAVRQLHEAEYERSVWCCRQDSPVRHIGEILAGSSGPAAEVVAKRGLSPDALSPFDATAYGSLLLKAGQWREAIPFLLRGVGGRPTAFGWSRIGKLCRELGYLDYSIEAYGRALELEPSNRHAIVGRAAVHAEHPALDLGTLSESFHRVIGLLGSVDDAPVVWAAHKLLESVCRLYPHPLLEERSQSLREFAAALRTETPGQQRAELEERLRTISLIQDLLGPSEMPAARPVAASRLAHPTEPLRLQSGPVDASSTTVL